MITGVILAHNEEHNICECIAALRPNVGELLLIDTESTDRTVELARPLVDRVLSHPNVPNFDAVRNIATPEARFDWLWFVDADERIPAETGRIVNELIRTRGHEFEAINIPFKSYFCGQWMQHCGWWPGYTVCRVLKRGHFEFGRILHSGVFLNGREIRFPPDPALAVPHYSFRDLEHYVSKINRYTSTEALQLHERKVPYDWRSAIRMMMHDLWEHFELHRAKLDGSRGWILTWMSGQYRWLSHAKLIDLWPRSEVASVPESLDELLATMEQDLAACRARRPQFPLGIVLRLSDTGAAVNVQELACLARACVGGDRPLAIETPASVDWVRFASSDNGLLKALCRAKRPKHAIEISFDPAATASPSHCAVINVLRTTWPLDAGQIPPEWLERARQFDELWVGCQQEATALRRRWIAPERIRVVDPVIESGNLMAEDQDDSPRQRLEIAIAELERRLQPPKAPEKAPSQIGVQLEGELFAGHSFSNVNENLLLEFKKDPSIAISVRRLFHNPAHDRLASGADELLGLVDRNAGEQPEITIRHAFPANWTPPESGVWVHIQPWEFRYLPVDWIPHLRDRVHEIWAPSNYVKQVYIDSGIAAEKIQVIPWGIAPEIFHPSVPPLSLSTDKTFRFLFVGGTILRKGFDRLLQAYLAEFGPEEDVCLVVKDTGVRSFYAHANFREQILEAIRDPGNPQIIYIDDDLTTGQLASLYAACQCLVAPYRGEGFGLPVLEAMACGVAPIVPRGGPTDDFTTDECAYRIDSRQVENPAISGLCQSGTEIEISLDELRRAMRAAATDRSRTASLGARASAFVPEQFTWSKTAQLMLARIQALAARQQAGRLAGDASRQNATQLTVMVAPTGNDRELANCFCRVAPFVGKVLVAEQNLGERSKAIAREYGVSILKCPADSLDLGDASGWVLHLRANEALRETDFASLQQTLRDLPSPVGAARVTIRTTSATSCDRLETRILRRQDSVDCTEFDFDQPDRLVEQFGLEAVTANVAIECHGPIEQPDTLNGDGSQLVDAGIAENGEPQVSPSKKGILIQLATGPHLELLEATRAHHRAYAERHGLDYWCVEGNPAAPKRAAWGKIPLILAAMQMGFERIVWLDADAVVLNSQVDLSQLVDLGIGMVQHPNPVHWNSGVMVIARSSATQRFFEAVNDEPENDSPWMEQLPINILASRPEFDGLLRPLDPAYNSTPGAVMAESPSVIAAHGLPHPLRRQLIAGWLDQARGMN